MTASGAKHRTIRAAWAAFWPERKREFITAWVLLVPVVWLFGEYLDWAEKRPYGWHFADPVLALFEPMNVSHVLLPLSWLSVSIGFWQVGRRPTAFLDFGQTYAVVMTLKVITMLLVPLYAPEKIIELKDPYIEATFYQGEARLRDLMFSGHTAQPLVLGLVLGPGRMRTFLFAVGAIVGCLVMVQHVHYSIDVLAAPFFAWLGWRMHRWLINHWRPTAYDEVVAAANPTAPS